MAGASGSLTFVLDQNFGPSTLQLLRHARVEPVSRITSLAELGYPANADDEDWMPQLGKRGHHVVVTRDGAILQAAIRVNAWERSGLTLLLLDGQWGQLPFRELSRALLYWWPIMVEQSEAAKPGTAWTVPHGVPNPSKQIRLVQPR